MKWFEIALLSSKGSRDAYVLLFVSLTMAALGFRVWGLGFRA